ncbi:MAG: 7TM domain-containing protein, partial [Alphaproteobacteria bacterium]|nr:7TM domain-containing protein [Alphaproteobacteria bacterium]
LILVFLRQFIGVTTFGPFLPVLLGLAFREPGLAWGLALFAFVLAAGLGFRFYFEKLQLHLVPRLAAVLVIVVLVMTALSVITERFQLGLGLSVALFPIVILTMTIERMSITWEEMGAADALKQALGSFLVAALAHAAMTIYLMEHLFFTFPELLLVILGIILMCGRYTGPRLVEIYRFRDLMKENR